jgi:effector-binding domain-containing protein
MPEILVRHVSARPLAAVRRHLRVGTVATAWRAALDQVWAFLRTHPGLHTDGHNVFVYHHPDHRDEPITVDFGVEVVRTFEPVGDVIPVTTPAGEAAIALHRGGYDGLHLAHDAIHAWAARHGRAVGASSWEIYGDASDDVSELETTVCYLLA